MTRKILTIEYDTDQDFFDPQQDGDRTLYDYLLNELDNDGFVASLHEVDAPETTPERRLEGLQDALKQFEDNFKHAVLTPLTYPEPPHWLAPLVRDLHAALEASKAE